MQIRRETLNILQKKDFVLVTSPLAVLFHISFTLRFVFFCCTVAIVLVRCSYLFSTVAGSKLWASGVTEEKVTSSTILSLVCGLFQVLYGFRWCWCYPRFYWWSHLVPSSLVLGLQGPLALFLLLPNPIDFNFQICFLGELPCGFCRDISFRWNYCVNQHASSLYLALDDKVRSVWLYLPVGVNRFIPDHCDNFSIVSIL